MTTNSRDQFRDAIRKSSHKPLRWTGQIEVIITRTTGEKFLVGTWWDPEPARQWAQTYTARHPGTQADVVELEFKDFYIPRKSNGAMETIETEGDIL